MKPDHGRFAQLLHRGSWGKMDTDSSHFPRNHKSPSKAPRSLQDSFHWLQRGWIKSLCTRWLLRLEVLQAYPVLIYQLALQGDDLFIVSKFSFSCLIQVVHHCIEELTAGKKEGNNAFLVLAHETPLSDAEMSWGKHCADDLQLDLQKIGDKKGKRRKQSRGNLGREEEKEGRDRFGGQF